MVVWHGRRFPPMNDREHFRAIINTNVFIIVRLNNRTSHNGNPWQQEPGRGRIPLRLQSLQMLDRSIPAKRSGIIIENEAVHSWTLLSHTMVLLAIAALLRHGMSPCLLESRGISAMRHRRADLRRPHRTAVLLLLCMPTFLLTIPIPRALSWIDLWLLLLGTFIFDMIVLE
mmetsp:Transcript_3428/g.9078  ORF Transcript_3428/g.9078 Transcript_3428/m.9078 type:complete len:172 (-) Transcript_3428:2114-2629(-)